MPCRLYAIAPVVASAAEELDVWRMRITAAVYGRHIPGLTSWPRHDPGSLPDITLQAMSLLDSARRPGEQKRRRAQIHVEAGRLWRESLLFDWAETLSSFWPIFGILWELERLVGFPGRAGCASADVLSPLGNTQLFHTDLESYLTDDARFCEPSVDLKDRQQRITRLYGEATRVISDDARNDMVDAKDGCVANDLASRYLVLARFAHRHAAQKAEVPEFADFAPPAQRILKLAADMPTSGLPGFSILRLLRYFEVENFMSHTFLKLMLPPAPVIFEAGADDGSDSVALCTLMPDATLFAFEPHPHTFQTASERIADSCIGSTTLFNVALSNLSSPVQLHLQAGSNGIRPSVSSIFKLSYERALAFSAEYTATSTVLVNATTIDDWADVLGIRKVDMFWLDLEGAESMVINATSFGGILSSARVIRVEHNRANSHEGTISDLPAIENGLRARGFHLLFDYKQDRLLGDAIFVRKECITGGVPSTCNKRGWRCSHSYHQPATRPSKRFDLTC